MRTRITVVVVVVVLLIGGAIFFSSVRSIRDAAAKTACKNNCRQIGVALANYESAYGARFPSATFGHPELPPERRLSWLFELDPFMHARMDPEWTKYRREPWDSDRNLELARQRMPGVNCPWDPSRITAEGYTKTNYVGTTGVGSDAATLPKEDRRAGFFGYDRWITLRDIKDGTGTTIAAIETSTDKGPWMAGGRPTSRAFEPDGPNAIGPGSQFGGFHRGGVNVCFADGSVRFIRDSIDRETFAALFTIAGGEEAGPIGE